MRLRYPPRDDGYRDVLYLHQVFEANLAGILDDLGPALIAVIFLDFLELVDDHAAQHFFGAQDFQVLADALLDIGELVEDLLLLHAGQALELQFDDGLRLPFAERGRADRRRQLRVLVASAGVMNAISASRASFGDFRRPDQGDDCVQIVQVPVGSRAKCARARAPCAAGNRCVGGPHRCDAR